MNKLSILLSLAASLSCVWALENNLAKTPPMGWISWQRYRCNIDCVNYPDDCISERLYMRMADELVNKGYRDVGYVQVNIDDCWSLKDRDSNGRLVADPQRFPSGIKALAKYMHDRKLKLGIYGDAGSKTCAGYPGSINSVEIDAQTFADWDVDMLKFDGCNINDNDTERVYTQMQKALEAVGKPIVYSCEWALYKVSQNLPIDYAEISNTCNIFRNYYDISDTFQSVTGTINYYVTNQDEFALHQRPGAFFDPDMLVIGDYGLNVDESKVQMAAWAIWGAPLFMSNDLSNVGEEYRKILQNKDVIALNQDLEGKFGKQILKISDLRIFARPVLPKNGDSYSFGIAAIFLPDGGAPIRVKLPASKLGLTDTLGYTVKDLFNNKTLGLFTPDDVIEFDVKPSGAVLLKATVNQV